MTTKKPSETENTLIPFIQPELPDHLANRGSLGNERVSAEDQTIPRLNLLQQLSPQCNEAKPEFVATAKAGLFHNSITNDLYESVMVVNLSYRRTIAAFKKRELGGGFAGNYEDTQAAEAGLIEAGLDPKSYDLVDTANHYCLLLDDEGAPLQTVMLSMNGSKMRVSNQWNTQIMARGDDIPRFSGVWKLSSVKQSNAKGTWSNIHVDYLGYASETLVNEAESIYKSLLNESTDKAA